MLRQAFNTGFNAAPAHIGSGTSVVLALGVGAILVYQLFIRPDEGPRTIREKLANQ